MKNKKYNPWNWADDYILYTTIKNAMDNGVKVGKAILMAVEAFNGERNRADCSNRWYGIRHTFNPDVKPDVANVVEDNMIKTVEKIEPIVEEPRKANSGIVEMIEMFKDTVMKVAGEKELYEIENAKLRAELEEAKREAKEAKIQAVEHQESYMHLLKVMNEARELFTKREAGLEETDRPRFKMDRNGNLQRAN